MKIVFCIHGCSTKPIGGHKVLYELANRLSRRGYEVEIVIPSYDNLYQIPLPSRFRVKLLRILTDYLYIMPGWFKIDRSVKRHTVYDYSDINFPDADIVIATAAETAEPVSKLPDRCGNKIYFIQGHETWMLDEKQLEKSYQLEMTNVVISKWLKRIVEKNSRKEAYYIPNAIDTKKFRVIKPIEDREAMVIGLLWHPAEMKGLKYAFKALEYVKSRYPDIRVIMFGATHIDKRIPDWFEFHYRASEKKVIDIYNRCSIFLCATIDEGFGLTGAESMACGCALVSTDYKGVREYAVNDYNALLSPVKDTQSLADNICRLIEDRDVRIRIASHGVESINQTSWEKVISRWESIFDTL